MVEETKKILLNSSNSKTSVNGDMSLNIDLSSDEKKFPSNGISDNIDQYKQYIKEKDASNKYRFVFTINSVCSNVLYNHLTEIIEKKDGNVLFFGEIGQKKINLRGEYERGKKVSIVNYPYLQFKENAKTGDYNISRYGAIKDTGYSHPRCGNFIYMPGIDIFNNHRFRAEEFVIVANKKSGEKCTNYNTIEDTVREYDGSVLKTIVRTTGETETHLYFKDTVKTYPESIKDNLLERDGWFGFINPTSLDIVNCETSIRINKVINNRKACEFIDLYPDRTLFSFMPVKNYEQKREEYNWDYCITYPYKNFYENELISLLNDNEKPILNGILTDFCDGYGNKLDEDQLNELVEEEKKGDEFSDIVLRTRIKNNIKNGDYIKIHLVINSDKYFTIKTNVKVRNVGIGGYNTMYYLTVNKGDILSGLKTMFRMNRVRRGDGFINTLDGLHCYIQRVASGRLCKYYFRKFRRLPNFKNTNIHNNEKLTENAIRTGSFNNFNSSLNKLGFGTNIYGDRMAQIVFADDVDITNIQDNLGRPLHEVYLTIVKTNRGNDKWYFLKKYSNKDIECSHCFSLVSSGLDMPWPYESDDENKNDYYNVHKLHNIPSTFSKKPKFPISVKALESNITVSGSTKTALTTKEIPIIGSSKKDDTTSNDNYDGTFFGDIVELDELNVQEYVLEDVQHRFNTMQREYTNDGEFSGMTVNEILTDDYDDKFEISRDNYLGNDTDYYVNLAAEGYYYKTHYRILLREFSDIVNEGQHIVVKFKTIETPNEGTIIGTTDKNYYFQKGDDIIVYNKNKKKYVCTVTNVSGNDFRDIEFKVDGDLDISDNNKSDYNIFKPNPIKPSTAYDFDDGSGVYKWRDIESFENLRTDSELYDSVFTNGAHYIHKNINFFLRRQDPYGVYGLNPVNNESFPYEYQLLEQPGKEEDITPAQHFIEGDIQIC